MRNDIEYGICLTQILRFPQDVVRVYQNVESWDDQRDSARDTGDREGASWTGTHKTEGKFRSSKQEKRGGKGAGNLRGASALFRVWAEGEQINWRWVGAHMPAMIANSN